MTQAERPNSDLTAVQARLLGAMCDHLEEHGAPPTIRALCAAVGYSSTNAAIDVLRALERKGWVERTKRGSYRVAGVCIDTSDARAWIAAARHDAVA